MTDSNGNRSDIKPPAKVFFVFSQIVIFIFGIPFAAFGIFALYEAWKNWHGKIHDPKHDPIFTAIFGLIFFAVGFGIMLSAVSAGRRKRKAEEKKLQQTDGGAKPWLLRQDWAEGKIKSSALAQPILMLIMGLAFCGIGGVSTFFGLPEVWQKHNYAALLVLFFPLAGLGMLAAFFVAWRSQKRFGKCFFELAQTPIPLGGILEGMIQTGKPLKLEHELNLKISCIRQVTTGSGKNRSTNDYILWQDEKIYSSQANLPEPESGHTGIPVHFKLADSQPQCFSRDNVSVFWRLEARSKMRGPDFRAVFDLPVFKVADAAVADDANEPDPTASLQAPIEEIRRDENSKIKISDGPDGREFYFPAARNPGAAMLTTAASIVCSGIAAGTFHLGFHSGVMILFPIIFGLIGILCFFGALSMWCKSSRITIDSTNVRATNHWLIFSRTRQFSTNDFSRFATKTGMQSGTQTFTDIKLIKSGSDDNFVADAEKFPKALPADGLPAAGEIAARFRAAAGPPGVTVASSIANVAEANWLVAEMNKALGRN
jgi:hypothetical protein